VRRGDGRCEMMSRFTGLPRATYYPDAGRWGLFPIGSRMSARPFSLILLLLKLDTSRFAYSRPADSTVYVSPAMALNRNASMIHMVITAHLLPVWCSFDSHHRRPH